MIEGPSRIAPPPTFVSFDGADGQTVHVRRDAVSAVEAARDLTGSGARTLITVQGYKYWVKDEPDSVLAVILGKAK